MFFSAYKFVHLSRYCYFRLFYFEQIEIKSCIAVLASYFILWQTYLICSSISFFKSFIRLSSEVKVFLKLTFDFLSFSQTVREQFTRDYLKLSKFLEILFAIDEIGVPFDGWWIVICSMRNFWNYERWVRVEFRFSALLIFSKSFWSIDI